MWARHLRFHLRPFSPERSKAVALRQVAAAAAAVRLVLGDGCRIIADGGTSTSEKQPARPGCSIEAE